MFKPALWLTVLFAALLTSFAAYTLTWQVVPVAAAPVASSVASTSADDEWKWVNPLPQGNTLLAIDCPTEGVCYAVGERGTVVTNRSGSWQLVASPLITRLQEIGCTNNNTCLVGTSNGKLFKTTDGGATWTEKTGLAGILQKLNCFSSGICYALTSASGYVFRTDDSGETWTNLALEAGAKGLDCPSIATCYAITSLMVYKTIDSGSTWVSQTNSSGIGGTNQLLSCATDDICFVTQRSSRVADDKMFKTSNGGLNWTPVTTTQNIGYALTELSCVSGEICYLMGDGSFRKWVEGAQSWQYFYLASSFEPYKLNFDCSIAACYIVGEGGFIGYYSATSAQITEQSIGSSSYFQDVECLDNNVCYAAGVITGGTILKATDFTNAQLITVSATYTDSLYSLSCADSNTCYATSSYGKIYKTTDSWANFITISMGITQSLGKLDCPTAQVCYVTASQNNAPNKLFITTDGGQNWLDVSPPVTSGISALNCLNTTTCYIGSYNLYKTTDGGQNWTETVLNTGANPEVIPIRDITCPSNEVCYVVRGWVTTFYAVTNPPPPPHLTLHKTVDGGQNWQNSPFGMHNGAISCVTTLKCWVSSGLGVKQTVDGQTWITKELIYPGVSANLLSSISCLESGCLFVAGRAILTNYKSDCSPFAVTTTRAELVCGTLAYALDRASAGTTITFTDSLPASFVITLPQGIDLKPGVSIDASSRCQSGGVTLRGNGANSGDGLTVNGGSQLSGLRIEGFSGRQLVLKSGGNVVKCTSARSS